MAAKPKPNEEPESVEELPSVEGLTGEEPDRVVDPPEASADDAGGSSGQKWVRIDQSGTLTLPSGASYAFSPGNTLQLSSEDASFVIDQGYGSETDAPSEDGAPAVDQEEPETGTPSEE